MTKSAPKSVSLLDHLAVNCPESVSGLSDVLIFAFTAEVDQATLEEGKRQLAAKAEEDTADLFGDGAGN